MGKAPIGAGKSSWVLMSTIMPSNPYLTYCPVFSGGGLGAVGGYIPLKCRNVLMNTIGLQSKTK